MLHPPLLLTYKTLDLFPAAAGGCNKCKNNDIIFAETNDITLKSGSLFRMNPTCVWDAALHTCKLSALHHCRVTMMVPASLSLIIGTVGETVKSALDHLCTSRKSWKMASYDCSGSKLWSLDHVVARIHDSARLIWHSHHLNKNKKQCSRIFSTTPITYNFIFFKVWNYFIFQCNWHKMAIRTS